MKTGIELITEERERQISKEDWTPEHDDLHNHRELARAGCAYVMHYIERSAFVGNMITLDNYKKTILSEPLDMWPEDWKRKDFKPETPLRTLVKAGALIAAEIDRLQRMQQPAAAAQLPSEVKASPNPKGDAS